MWFVSLFGLGFLYVCVDDILIDSLLLISAVS